VQENRRFDFVWVDPLEVEAHKMTQTILNVGCTTVSVVPESCLFRVMINKTKRNSE